MGNRHSVPRRALILVAVILTEGISSPARGAMARVIRDR
jgi:hypothetical protein